MFNNEINMSIYRSLLQHPQGFPKHPQGVYTYADQRATMDNSNSPGSSTGLFSHGRLSWLGSRWASISSRDSCLSGSISSCRRRSRRRCWKGRSLRRSLMRVRYVTFPLAPWNDGRELIVSDKIIGIRTCKGQVWIRFRSLRSGSEPRLHLLRCSA